MHLQPAVVAVVDDDPLVRMLLQAWLSEPEQLVEEHALGRSILDRDLEALSVVCLDLSLGDMDGFQVLARIRDMDPELPVIVITAQPEVETAVLAMQKGAYDYLIKPFEKGRVVHAVRRARERRELSQRLRIFQTGPQRSFVLVGESAAMREVYRQIAQIRASDVSVCILGESGTGKELVARAIHHESKRSVGPFVALNCAAVPESLQESELFGHEKGAFTGALGTHIGRFEQATGGTLFLDEVGEMPPSMQAKLLRVLQERTFRRVGGSRELEMNARIICATNLELETEVQAGRFRTDLYFRLVVYPIRIPPLRARRDDIPQLVGHFLRRLSSRLERNVSRVAPDALDRLIAYDWPGNVRELENILHRALLSCLGEVVTLSDLPSEIRVNELVRRTDASPPRRYQPDLPMPIMPLAEIERLAIHQALEHTRGDVKEAARLLKTSRATLYRRLAGFDRVVTTTKKR